MIGIEPEIVQCAEANGVCVRILGQRLACPGQCARHLVGSPWIIAESCVADGSVVRETRMVRRGMKSDVTYVDSGPERHTEGLNRAIEVLVINRVFIVPDAGTGVGYFVAHKPDTIIARVGFELTYRRTVPSVYGRLLAMGDAKGVKTESRRAATDGVLMV